jgi:predicted acylesterase/phospholipase RssA
MGDATRVVNPLVAARGGLASITQTGTGLAEGQGQGTTVQNPLLKAQRNFLVRLGDKQHKVRRPVCVLPILFDSLARRCALLCLSRLFFVFFASQVTSSARSKMVLMSEVRRQLNLVTDFHLLLWDEDVEEWVEFERWSDLPIGKAKLKVVELESFRPTLLSKGDIDKETSNELIFWHESKSDKRIRMHLHPINYGRMRHRASHQWCPVVSFLGPTGGGKSSLICKFKPKSKPIVALDAQPIPTTSNINSFVVAGDKVAPSVQTGVLPATARFAKRRDLAQQAGRSAFPYMRLLDIEGEDGGLPLMEYCKSEGGGLDELELSSNDVVEFVRQLFEKCDKDDLNSYMETRKRVTKRYFPRLSYLTSDVVVYVNTVPPKRESEYLDRIREFASYSHKGVSSAERPSLIMVYNQCRRNEAPFDIDEATDHFFLLVDREKELLDSFRSVDFVKIPDWDHESLYKSQLEAFRERLLLRIVEQRAARHMAGTLFSDVVWFSVLDKVLEHFEDEAISMSKIFARFIISESSLVNRAYHFFDHVYARHNSKELFLRCRAVTLRMLGAFAVQKHHGDESVLHNEDTYIKLLDQFLERIKRRTPCEKTHRGYKCVEELSLHDAHRFPTGKTAGTAAAELVEVPGSHSFNDPDSMEDMLELLVSTATTFPPPDDKAAFYGRLREIFVDGVKVGTGYGAQPDDSNDTTSADFDEAVAMNPEVTLEKIRMPQDRCFVCLRNKHDVMLSCTHEFCSECVEGFVLAHRAASGSGPPRAMSPRAGRVKRLETEDFPCPLCGLKTAAVPSADAILGFGGIRILSLDGGGFRAALHVRMLQRLCEFAELEIRDLFDYVIGTGVSGPLALALTDRRDLEDLNVFFSSLPSVLKRRPAVQKAIGKRLFEFIFGSTFSSAAFEREMASLLGDRSHTLLQQVMRSHEPRVSIVTSDVTALVEMRILGNYPPGKRNVPKFDCDVPLCDAGRASAAIPDVFDPFVTAGDKTLVDGSLFGVNPTLIALSEAQRVWGYDEDFDFVLSLGTGLQSSKNPKGENYLRFMNETIDFGAMAAKVESQMDVILPEENYVRLNPDTPLSGRDKTTNPSTLKTLLRYTDNWIQKNRANFTETALRLKGKCFVIDGPESVEVGTTFTFAIRSRLRPEVSMADPEFHVVLNDGPLGSASHRPGQVKIKKASRSHGGVTSRHTDKWSVAIRPKRAGQYQLHVMASFPDRLEKSEFRVHIGGSPLVLNVVSNTLEDESFGAQAGTSSGDETETRSKSVAVPKGLPPKRFIPFSEFVQLIPISKSGPVQEAEEEDEVLTQHKEVVRERVDRYGLLSPTLIQSPRRTPDCMFRACADFLFGTPERHDYVRRCAAGWLRTHSHARVQNGPPISELMRQDDIWDDYCSAIERDTTWGDPLVLFAIVQHFGCRAVVISSCPGTRYVSEITPQRYKRVGTLLLAQWAKFAWAAARPWSSAQLFKPEPKALDQTLKLQSGQLSASPRGMEFKTDQAFLLESSATAEDSSDPDLESQGSVEHHVSVPHFDAHDVDSKDPFVHALRDASHGWTTTSKGDSQEGDAFALSTAAELSGAVLPCFAPEGTLTKPPVISSANEQPTLIERTFKRHEVEPVSYISDSDSFEVSPLNSDEEDLLNSAARTLFSGESKSGSDVQGVPVEVSPISEDEQEHTPTVSTRTEQQPSNLDIWSQVAAEIGPDPELPIVVEPFKMLPAPKNLPDAALASPTLPRHPESNSTGLTPPQPQEIDSQTGVKQGSASTPADSPDATPPRPEEILPETEVEPDSGSAPADDATADLELAELDNSDPNTPSGMSRSQQNLPQRSDQAEEQKQQHDVSRVERAKLLFGGETTEEGDEFEKRELRRLLGSRPRARSLGPIGSRTRTQSLGTTTSSRVVSIDTGDADATQDATQDATPVNQDNDADVSEWDSVIARLREENGPEAREVVVDYAENFDLGAEASLAGDFTNWRFIAVPRGSDAAGGRTLAFAVRLPLRAGDSVGYLFKVNGSIARISRRPSTFNPEGQLANKLLVPQ